ncbi:glycosyltransferase family 2 protein [Candidatus Woesearchaeota archaeon]|nr:glycosyltransferase family 2 protein [Candidatus Woesearchaeota archaeon]
MKKKIVVVIPAYNCSLTIENVFRRVPKDFLPKIYRFVVVNDGSRDDTQEVLEKLKKKYRQIAIIQFKKNRGYGAVQKAGFTEALNLDADVSVLLHSDGQYPPEMLDKMLEPIISSMADVVIGSRILGRGALKGGMPLYKYVGNRTLTLLENFAFGMNVSEYHTGYTVYSKKALKSIPFTKLSNTFHFDGEMIMMSGKKGLRIKEIPIPTRYANEKSHLNPISYGLDVLNIIFKYLVGRYDF